MHRRGRWGNLRSSIASSLADERVVEVMVNEDGAVWCDRLGEGMSLVPDRLSADRAASLVGSVAALLNRVANAEHPIIEGELPFFGFRFEGIVPSVSPHATVAIRKPAPIQPTEEVIRAVSASLRRRGVIVMNAGHG